MAETQNLSIFGWTGLDSESSPLVLGPQDAPVATNVYFGDRGEVIRRDGYSIYTTGADPADEGRFLFHFRAANKDNSVIAYIAESGLLYFLDVGGASTDPSKVLVAPAGAQATLASAGTPNYYQKAAAVFGNYLYLTDIGAAIKVAGMVAGDPTPFATQISDRTLDGSGAEFPGAKTLAVWNDRMVAGNVTSGGTRYRSRLWFSDVNDPDTWQATSWLIVGPDDGGEIQQILVYGDSLLVWKDNALYAVTGDYPDLSIQLIHGELGTTAGLSVAQDQSRVFWYDPDQGVFMFDGAQVHRIDQKVHANIRSTAGSTGLHRSHGMVWNDRYYLSLPSTGAGGPDYTFVYHIQTGAWSKWDLGWRSTCVYEGTVHASGLAAGEEGVAKLFQGSQKDNGTAFTWTFETAWLPPITEAGTGQYRLHSLRAFFKPNKNDEEPSGSNVSISIYTDWNVATATRTITGSTQVNPYLGVLTYDGAVLASTGVPSLLSSFKLKFTQTGTAGDYTSMTLFGFVAVLSAREQKQSSGATA